MTRHRPLHLAPLLLLVYGCSTHDATSTSSDEAATTAAAPATAAPATPSPVPSGADSPGSPAPGSPAPGSPTPGSPAPGSPTPPGAPSTTSHHDSAPDAADTTAATPATDPDATSEAAPSPPDASDDGQTTSSGEPPSREWNATLPTFTAHTIAAFSSGYYTLTVDVDRDGKPDVVALSSGNAGLVWFKNPTWEKFTITTKTQRFICLGAHDVDGDGDTDLAIGSEFDMSDSTGGGTIYLAEAPDDPTTNQEWPLHLVDSIPTTHRLRFADIDGNGHKELIALPIFGVGSSAPEHVGPVALTAYTVPTDLSGSWAKRVLDDTRLEVAHGISVVDWDGDGAEDLLTAANDGVDLFRGGANSTPLHVGDGKDGARPDRGSSEAVLGSLGDRRFVATIEPWHGTDAVVYSPGETDAAAWTRRTLGADFEHGHAMLAADLNNDGYDEIIGGGGQGDLAQLIYQYIPATDTWQKVDLDVGGVAVSGMDVTDINGDGALDIVSIGGSPTNNVVWYESTP